MQVALPGATCAEKAFDCPEQAQRESERERESETSALQAERKARCCPRTNLPRNALLHVQIYPATHFCPYKFTPKRTPAPANLPRKDATAYVAMKFAALSCSVCCDALLRSSLCYCARAVLSEYVRGYYSYYRSSTIAVLSECVRGYYCYYQAVAAAVPGIHSRDPHPRGSQRQ